MVIAYLFFSWLVPEDTQPTWIRDARSLPILKNTGDAIVSLLPEDPASALPGRGDKKEDETPPEQRSMGSGESVYAWNTFPLNLDRTARPD